MERIWSKGAKTKCHFNINLLVMNKQAEEKENIFFKSEGRTVCSLATDVKEIFHGWWPCNKTSWAWHYTKGSKLNTNTCIRNVQPNWRERVKCQIVLSLIFFFFNNVAGMEVLITAYFFYYFSYFPREMNSTPL